MRKTSVWLGPIALAVLVAAPYVGAGNGSTDTDSPYNMPALTDGGSGSGASGGNNGGGNGNGGGSKSASGEAGGNSAGTIAPVVLTAQVGGTISVVPSLHGGAFASIDGAKVASAGANASNRSKAVVEVSAHSGSKVVAVDSNPSQGDSTVEVSGAFDVRGAGSLVMVTAAPFDQSNDLLFIGPSDPVTGALTHIDSVIPLVNVGPLLDVTAVNASLAAEPLLAGKTAVIALGQTEAAIDGSSHFKFAAVVQFKIATNATFQVDTAPHLP